MRYFGQLITMITCLCVIPNCFATLSFPTEFTNAFKNGSPLLDFRLRQEDSKQSGVQAGYATTLRTTVGFESAEFYQTLFKVELVDVSHFFGMHYNPGVSDLFLPQYTLIADPPGAGITEIKATYTGFNNNTLSFGRQYIALDNQRFIGLNDFRQFPQSFDAFSWNCVVKDLDFYYAYLIAVNTNYGNGRATEGYHSLSSNLLNLDWSGTKLGRFVMYLYMNNDHTFNTNSNITVGGRWLNPEDLTLSDNYIYLFEIAWQKSQFNNPSSYDALYFHGVFGRTIEFLTGEIGFERLGGNANAANKVFITPLGSVDNFNGMAEVFTTTPNQGLQDAYATITASNYDVLAGITYHFFMLDKGRTKLAGHELDIYADIKITSQLEFSIGYATYTPKNNVAPNTKRFWVMLTADLL